MLGPDGLPAAGVLVVSSAGGRAFSDAAGGYRLVVELPLDATSIQVTAVGGAVGNASATQSVAPSAGPSAASVVPLRLAPGSSCSPGWLPTFGQASGTEPSQCRNAAVVFDDGSGPAVYVGDDFTGEVSAKGVARWDGETWTSLSSGMDGLHVNGMARWTGSCLRPAP